MISLRQRYERFSENFTPTKALMYLLFYVFMSYIGVLEILKSFNANDQFYKYSGLITFLIGATGLFHAVQVFRAVMRRRRSDHR